MVRLFFILLILFFTPFLWGTNIFPVHLYVDEEFRDDPYWFKNLESMLEEVNARYRREFEINFIWHEPVYWESDNSHTSIFSLLDQLSQDTASRTPGITMGFTGQTELGGQELGVARYFTGHIMIKKSDYMMYTIVHEMGHIFGGVHVEGTPFLMNARYTGIQYLPFDIWNIKIVELNRGRSFGSLTYPISEEDAFKVSEVYQELLTFGRSDKALYINLGSVLSTIGQHDEAVQILREAETYFYMESLMPGADKAKNLSYLKKTRESLGFVLYRKEEYLDAIMVLEKLYEEDSGNNFVQWYLGASYLGLEDYFRAKEFFEDMKKRIPHSIPVALSLGITYEKLEIPSLAEEQYFDAIRINPDNFKGYAYLGYLYNLQKKWDKAIRYLNEAITRNPSYGQLLESRGLAHYEQGSTKKALKDYLEALKYDPSLPVARYNAGLIYFNQGKLKDAVREFKKLITHHPDDARGYHALGTIYLKQNEVKKSKKMYEKAVKRDNTLSDVYVNLYHIYRRLGLEKKAQKAAKRYQKLTGKSIQ